VTDYVEIDHPKFRRVQRDIFLKKVEPDCMNHQCNLVKDNNRVKLDACCQYGADVDVSERDGILIHKEQIQSILNPETQGHSWFTEEEKIDKDFPTGKFVRTRTFGEGCLFLSHDGRGCAIHRASIEGGWDFHGIKPHVCRLFPLSYDEQAIVISDDYPDYSCAYDSDAPSLYRVGREGIQAIFGEDLIYALDRAEARVLSADREATSYQGGLRVLS